MGTPIRVGMSALCLALAVLPCAAQGLLWGGSIGGELHETARQVVVDAQGRIYVLGTFDSPIDVDPGPGNVSINPIGAENVVLIKLDTDGTLLWARVWGGSTIFLGAVATAPGGDVTVSGRFEGTVDFDPGAGLFELTAAGGSGFLVTLDQDGDFVRAEDSFFLFHGLGVDSSGNLYGVAGRNVVKRNAGGTVVWTRQFQGGGNAFNGSVGQAVVGFDDDDNLYLTGGLTGTIDFDPGAGTTELTSAGGSDVVVAKMTPAGNLAWARAFGGSDVDGFGAIDVSPEGFTLLTGKFRGTADLDPGPGTLEFTAEGAADCYLTLLDQDGDLVWTLPLGGTGDEECTGVAFDGAGNAYVTGSFELSVDFDPGGDVTSLTAVSLQDAFVARFDVDGAFGWVAGLQGTNGDGHVTVDVDAQGDVIALGEFTGIIDLDPGPGAFPETRRGFADLWVVKLEGEEQPLLVSLESFTAEITRRGILLRWRTAQELDNAGFRLLRQVAGRGGEKSGGLVTLGWIPGRGSGLDGAEYVFLDNGKRPRGSTLRYHLEDVDAFGRATRHGPVAVRLP